MLQAIADQIQTFLGYDRDVGDVNAIQMALRTVLIYAGTLLLIRLGSKRFLSQATAFDVIVGIMLGSVMSRAINGSAPLVPTVLAGAAFVGLHWLLSVLAFRVSWFGPFVKGRPFLLIKDGGFQRQGLGETGMSEHDLTQALRLQARQTDPSKVELAYLERGGSISVVPRRDEPRIIDVSIADGVQTVRIEID